MIWKCLWHWSSSDFLSFAYAAHFIWPEIIVVIKTAPLHKILRARISTIICGTIIRVRAATSTTWLIKDLNINQHERQKRLLFHKIFFRKLVLLPVFPPALFPQQVPSPKLLNCRPLFEDHSDINPWKILVRNTQIEK